MCEVLRGWATSDNVSSTTRFTSMSAASAAPVREKLSRLLTLPLGHVIEEQQTADALIRFAHQRSDGNVQGQRFSLMMESLLIDAGNLFLVTARGDFARQFLRQQRAELPSNGFLARHSEKLFHARVPGFDDALQINGKHADVQGFNDIFAEVLEPRDFEGFLFERAVELRVVESDGDVAGDGLNQLDVIAGQKISIDRLAEAEDRDGVLADAAGDKIIEVQLFNRAPNGVTDISCRTGRLKKERPAGKLGPGRLEEAKIQRLRQPHTHRTGNPHLAGLQGAFHKNRQPVDQ